MLLRSLSQFWILNTCLLIRHFTNLLASHFIEYKNDLITQRNHITSFHSLRNCPQSRRKKQGISGSEIWVVQSYLIVQREPPQLSCRTERLFTRTFFSWLQMETHQWDVWATHPSLPQSEEKKHLAVSHLLIPKWLLKGTDMHHTPASASWHATHPMRVATLGPYHHPVKLAPLSPSYRRENWHLEGESRLA